MTETPDHQPLPQPASAPLEIPMARPLVAGVRRDPGAGDILLLRESRWAACIDLLLMAAALVVQELLVVAYTKTFLDPPPVDSPEFKTMARGMLVPVLGFRAAMVIVTMELIRRWRGQSPRTIGLGAPQFGWNVLIGIGTTAAAYALILLWVAVVWIFFPQLKNDLSGNVGKIIELLPRLSLIGFVQLAFLVGVYEELLFRGFVMPRLRRVLGSWTLAVLCSTVIFTALHAADQTRSALVLITLLSLVFSAVTVWRRSLTPAIVGHVLFDLSQFISIFQITQGTP